MLPHLSRRQFCVAAGAAAATVVAQRGSADDTPPAGTAFRLRYILSSCMYGETPLAEILPEVKKTGATAIDIWPRVHGNQREQLDELGEQKFTALLKQHGVQLGCLTRYDLGPFGLQDELPLAQRLGCRLIVTGGKGPKGLEGTALKEAVKSFCEQMKPHLELAAETGVTIAIENHANNLFESVDSLKWLVDHRPSEHLAIAFAPAHLPQDALWLGRQLSDLAHAVAMFYAWQYGDGFMQEAPVRQQLRQLPGRGQLNFAPLLDALAKADYRGWTSIFMHPTPRGIPILASTTAVTDEINRARAALETALNEVR